MTAETAVFLWRTISGLIVALVVLVTGAAIVGAEQPVGSIYDYDVASAPVDGTDLHARSVGAVGRSGVEPWTARRAARDDGIALRFGLDSAAPRSTVSITDDGLAHVLDRHVPGGALSSGKSVFGAGEDVAALIRQAENVAPVTQANGRLAHVVDAGRTVGTDRATNALTTQYTVITEVDGTLVTAFPGLPGG